ncbi:hypothetical protein AB0Q95_32445 [Streptomyces sp. NPDC059900]|uniref:hypothetical protein n=1 Tax=Streptomyces sp. NPDC059900 TaxID=3155816 RepID=UPI003443756F
MSRNETPEEHEARMQAALKQADAINAATQKQPTQDTTVVHGERYSGTVQANGDVTFTF